VHAPLPDDLGGGRIRWGDEVDVRRLDPNDPSKVPGYLAKYATKSTELAGGVLHRVSADQVDGLAISSHVRAYLHAGFALAENSALTDRRFGRYAHAFGYCGHCLSKSRRYSTTFKALRQTRERHVHEQLLRRASDASQRALADITKAERIATFRYVGQGHLTSADAFLAASAAARAREQRLAAREALATAANRSRTIDGRTDGNRRRAGEQ
jgi:replication initiator protein RepSA